jgi:hypothetical protein
MPSSVVRMQLGSLRLRQSERRRCGGDGCQTKEADMIKKFLGIVAALMAALTLGVLSASTASAAPIDCPGGQTATKTASGWDCVNNAGNTSNAEDPKNPNAGKGDF